MKLIDKDVLIWNMRGKKYSKSSMALIESQPEVEAIPVTWLLDQYLNGLQRAGCAPRSETIKELIMNWRKENDR